MSSSHIFLFFFLKTPVYECSQGESPNLLWNQKPRNQSMIARDYTRNHFLKWPNTKVDKAFTCVPLGNFPLKPLKQPAWTRMSMHMMHHPQGTSAHKLAVMKDKFLPLDHVKDIVLFILLLNHTLRFACFKPSLLHPWRTYMHPDSIWKAPQTENSRSPSSHVGSSLF